MFYTLDAKALMQGPEYRLQRDNGLRQINGDNWRTINSSDRVYRDYSKLLVNQRLIEDNTEEIDKETARILQRHKLFPRLHHDCRPDLPQRRDLRRVIAQGDDSEESFLYLDINGSFNLDEVEKIELIKAKKRLVAVRYKEFKILTDSVGLKAAENNQFIGGLYLAMLHGWYHHLASGELDQYVETKTSRKEADILSDIERVLLHPPVVLN